MCCVIKNPPLRQTLCETLCALCLCGETFVLIFFHHGDTEHTEFHRGLLSFQLTLQHQLNNYCVKTSGQPGVDNKIDKTSATLFPALSALLQFWVKCRFGL